ncbi:MAG: ABC transporter substrate-binding protein [Flavobacteriales bacterium]|nr:ABC transporter substrate-binding protein [Flavobacteriales bacterium]
MRPLSIYTSWIILILLFISSCSSEKEKVMITSGSDKYGGIFAYNESGTINTLFPARGYFQSEIQVISFITEPLVKMAPDMSIVPCIAESWSVNEDGTEYTFKIRNGVYFHDSDIFSNGEGRALVASDVAFCFQKACEDFPGNTVSHYFRGVLKGASKYFDGQADIVSGIELIDDQTLKLTLKDPFSDLLALLSNACLGIYPEEYLKNWQGDLDHGTIGTGPFKISSFDKEKLLLLEKNQRYWALNDEGTPLPYLSAIKMTFEKDKKVVADAFKGQMINFIPNLNTAHSSLKNASEDSFTRKKNPIMRTKFLGLYMPNEVVANKQVRKALQYAIDKDLLVDSVLNKKGIPAKTGMIPPIFSDYVSLDNIGYKLDPISAKHSLELSGLEMESLNNLEIYSTNSEEDVNVANAIRKMFKDNLDLSISVKYFHPSEYYELIESGKATLFIDGYTGDYPSPDNFLYNLFYGKYLPKGDEEYSGFNLYRYKNPFFDNLLDSARHAKTKEFQIEYFQKAEKMLMSDAAVIPLYYDETEYGLNKDLQNFVIDPLNLFDLRKVYFNRSSQ